jgi:hypothetical protein
VEPQQVYPVKISFISDDAGIFRSQIEVKAEGFYNFQKTIDVNATSVEYNRFFIDQNGQQIGFLFNYLDSISFDSMYFGSSNKFQTFLVNNTPKKTHFKNKIRIGSASSMQDSKNINSLQTPKELGEEQTLKIVSCIPESGYIDSYSQIPITFKCEPKITGITYNN